MVLFKKTLKKWFRKAGVVMVKYDEGLHGKPIDCKTPIEIDQQYRAYKTRLANLEKKWKNLNIQCGSSASIIHSQMYKLNIKIGLMENLLKLDK